jgi:uncharacterized membrane protein YebE (DUF533 family)
MATWMRWEPAEVIADRWRKDMKLRTLAATALTATIFTMPCLAQETHEDAVAQTHAHDAHHHTKAKFVGGGAVGGALVGAKVGGPVGAVVGAGVGAGAGLVANKAHRHHEIRKREENSTPGNPR